MYLRLIITIDRARSTLLLTIDNVNTVCACAYFAANLEKLSYLLIVLMGHTTIVQFQYLSSLDVKQQWLTRDIGHFTQKTENVLHLNCLFYLCR